MDTEDRDLITRIAQKEQEALRCLYEKYRQNLYGYLWRQLNGNQSEVEDTLQEIFLAVWHGAEKFRGDAQVITWMFQIAHYQIRAILRKHRYHGTLSLSEDDEADPSVDHIELSPEDEIINRLVFHEAFHSLTLKHREVIELVYYQGFTLEEVARITNLPLGTIKSRLSYARRALSKAIHVVTLEEEASL
jgi:RNA polymerase sigma-70 factor (ECF subfamily)